MIRALVLDWHMWIVYYVAVAVIWGASRIVKHAHRQENLAVASWGSEPWPSSVPMPTDQPMYASNVEPALEAEYDETEDVFTISPNMTAQKPEWMK